MKHSPVSPAVAGSPLPLLASPQCYVACGLDLANDPEMCAYWLNLFRSHFPTLLEEAVTEAAFRNADRQQTHEDCQAAADAFNAYLDRLALDPGRDGRLDILTICRKRQQVLRAFGLDDPYRLIKQRENEAALSLLPAWLDELDATDTEILPGRLIEGVFAGNVFDLGVQATLDLFRAGDLDFHSLRSKLKSRPWLIDNLDPWVDRLKRRIPYRCAVLFVDNAGCDIVLGMIPFARYLLSRGTEVILAANSLPALNDITHDELASLIKAISPHDPLIADAVRDGRLELIPTGNDTPLIDLAYCDPRLNRQIADRGVDLIVLEGMGRSLESNFNAQFTCDALKIAMIKDMGVARTVNGNLYDLVLRYEPARKID